MLSELTLAEPLGSGGFAEVFAIAGDPSRCVKIARTTALKSTADDAAGYCDVTGAVAASPMQPHEVLIEQGKLLQSLSSPRWVTCHEIGRAKAPDGEQRAALLLQRCPGRALQQGDSPKLVLAIARAVMEQPHYDLKPSNVRVNGAEVTLLDPGYSDGSNLVTNTAYNPYLVASDISALGLLLRFVLTGLPPPSADASAATFSQGVRTAMAQQRVFGRNGLARTLAVKNDKTFALFGPIIFRSINLRMDAQGTLHHERPFASVAELVAALEVCA